MTPTTTPDLVRGDVPGLLCRGMPVTVGTGVGLRSVVVGVRTNHAACSGLLDWSGLTVDTLTTYELCTLTIDWSDRAAILLAVAWLADRGHLCGWMLPATHGGKMTDHAGLDAWTVAAILVARSVGRVARGLGPVRALDYAFRPVNVRMSMDNIGGALVVYSATDADRDHFVAPTRLGPDVKATPDHVGWMYSPACGLATFGMETGAEAVAKINACALADGVALCDPAGIIVPELEPA